MTCPKFFRDDWDDLLAIVKELFLNKGKLRVIQISATGCYGGLERSLLWFAKAANKSKFEYYFIFLYQGGPLRDEIASMGYPTAVLAWKNGYSLAGRLGLMKTILKINPHLIHDHGLTPLSRIFMKLAATQAPIINTQHGLGNINKNALPFLRIDDRVTDLVIANSNFTAQKHSLLFGRPLSKIKTIYLGINPDTYRDLTSVAHCTSDKKQLKITFIGRLAEYKGVLHIPLLARALLDRDEDFIINVAGNGPMLEKCMNLSASMNVSEHVRYLGWKSNVAEILHESDILVFLSLCDEAFGLVLIEAIAAGVPVFAYSGGGVAEAIGNAPNCWIIPKGDYEQMASLIIMKKDQCLNCDRLAGNDYVKENYNILKTARELENTYNEYIRSK